MHDRFMMRVSSEGFLFLFSVYFFGDIVFPFYYFIPVINKDVNQNHKSVYYIEGCDNIGRIQKFMDNPGQIAR